MVPDVAGDAVNDRASGILAELERVRGNLLALSDDIWNSIDHNDPQALTDGIALKQAYNEVAQRFERDIQEFQKLAERLRAQRQVRVARSTATVDGTANGSTRMAEHTSPTYPVPPVKVTPAHTKSSTRFDVWGQRPPRLLDEDFTNFKLYGFTFQGVDHPDIESWRAMYLYICTHMAAKEPARFARLPTNPKFQDARGKPMFSTDATRLNDAVRITGGIYGEFKVSATYICRRIMLLLDEFGIARSALTIYLD